MTSIYEIEAAISKALQNNVTFTLENKIVKKGKLILFCIKDFFCVFTLVCPDRGNKKIIYEIPYPFSMNTTSEKIVFDYTALSFCKNNKNIDSLMRKLNISKPSKYYNKRLTITLL